MIIVKLQGGLGNQMFQYAFGSYLAQKHQTVLKFDLSFLLDRSVKSKHVFRDFDLGIFGIAEFRATNKEINQFKNRIGFNPIDKILNRLMGLKNTYVREPHYPFSQKVFASGNNVYLEGYFQSEKYFEPIKDYIKEKYAIKNAILESSKELALQIKSKNSVCVNIRRGDFITNPFHGALPPSYYNIAEDLLLKEVDDLSLYVFSDDIDWCLQNLKFKSSTIFVSDEHNGEKFENKLRLMSYCKHFIIPNSTFAWWAAYLANNVSKIVISPNKWYNDPQWPTIDLLPDTWIKLNEYNF